MPEELRSSLAARIRPSSQVSLGLTIAAPVRSEGRRAFKLHFVQRHTASKRVVGGVAVQVNLR